MNPFRGLLLGELFLGVVALVWAVQSETDVPYRLDRETLLLSAGLTLALAAANFTLFFVGRRFELARPVYEMFEVEIFPILRLASPLELLAVAAVAGFAEELLFRGMLMPRMGLVASSVLFGVLHGPDYKLWTFALWATLVGAGFGVMYRMTGNLAVPVLVHGLYDALALAYIRYTPPRPKAETPDA